MAKENRGRKYESGDKNKEFQEVLRRLCTDGMFRASVKANHAILSGYEFTPFQITTLIEVGHASGKYSFKEGHGFCCCCGPGDMIKYLGPLTPLAAPWEGNLGPLTPLAGTWEGDEGYDIAPAPDRGTRTTRYREEIKFKPIGPVKNHEQILYGLEYSTKIWRLDNDKLFHEEVGYWLWDFQAKQVLRCFIVPRGVTVLAGGTVEPDANTFKLFAEVGSETYGICSNLFLDKEFKTVRYKLEVTIHDDRSFSYDQDTQLQIKGQANIFPHTDKNTLYRSE